MKFLYVSFVAALTLISMFVSQTLAQTAKDQSSVTTKAASGQMSMMIADEVRHRLVMLPYYGVFDWLECEITPDRSAVLRGQVTRPSTKSDAEAELRRIEGIPKVTNQIEVLPPSPSDDQIRLAVYRSIFKYDGPLFRYATQSVPPIHIIVNNGRVTLKGKADNDEDRQLAYTAANSVSGVFEVKNELSVRKPTE
jgi:hyperosmotically inducible periplasmic protein